MKNERRACPMLWGLMFLCVEPASFAASPASDPAAAEAVRKTDAAWAQAADTGNVDAWMAFYSADAIVLLPHESLVSGKERARAAVTHLLQRPHLSVAWRPLMLEVAAAGDLAYVIASYELHFGDSGGSPAADHGRHLEVWRLQSDGTWRCISDAWISDELRAASAQRAAAAAAPPGVAAASVPATAPAAAEQSSSSGAAPIPDAKYGPKPVHSTESVRRFFREHLTNPDSIEYRQITQPEPGYVTGTKGTFLMSETRTYGWLVKATINAKSAQGGYVGFRDYTFVFRGEELVATRSPPPAGEIH